MSGIVTTGITPGDVLLVIIGLGGAFVTFANAFDLTGDAQSAIRSSMIFGMLYSLMAIGLETYEMSATEQAVRATEIQERSHECWVRGAGGRPTRDLACEAEQQNR